MKFSSLWRKHAVIVLLLAAIAPGACFYQTQKVGLHEDEVYTIASAVNPGNGLLTAYEDNLMPEHGTPVWKTSQEVRDFVTLNPENYFNHMKFLPEMMLYDHSLILNTTRGSWTCWQMTRCWNGRGVWWCLCLSIWTIPPCWSKFPNPPGSIRSPPCVPAPTAPGTGR